MKNPLQFPSYTQRFSIEFPDAETASHATASIAPLPLGKKVAFTTRWDDSNPRHLKQAQTLAAHGMKGSFFLNEVSDEFLKQTILPTKETGSVFGNHGLGHPMFFQHTPNYLFETVILFQTELEAKVNMPIVSLTFPCGRAGGRGDLYPGGSALFGDMLSRGGIYSFPETKPDMAEFLHRDKDCCFGSYLFSANDSAPDETMFREGFERCYQAALADPDMPRVTLGVHTWQSDEGFEVLDRLYKEYSGHPEIWYCNENEFAAYRYNYYHAEVKKELVDGNVARFSVRRFEPAFAGAMVDLCILFSEGAEPMVLPEDAKHCLPNKIEKVDLNDSNSKSPEVDAQVELLGNGNFSICFTNCCGMTMEDIVCTLVLPMKWKDGLHRMECPTLPAGGRFETEIDPGEASDDPLFRQDRAGYDLQIDFCAGNERRRIHFVKMEPYEQIASATPRDTVRILGPFPKGTVPEKCILPMTAVGSPLVALGDAPNLQWTETSTKGCMPFAFTPCAKDATKEYLAAIEKCSWPEAGDLLFALDFDGGDCRIALDQKYTVCFWIDGVRFEPAELSTLVHLDNKRHRLVVLGHSANAWAFYPNRYSLGIYDAATGETLPCHRC